MDAVSQEMQIGNITASEVSLSHYYCKLGNHGGRKDQDQFSKFLDFSPREKFPKPTKCKMIYTKTA